MKRLGAWVLAFCLLMLCGCSYKGQRSGMDIVDGAYIYTPQEYIDLMNQTLENQKDYDYLTIPNWDEDTAGFIWVTISFYIDFDVNDSGKITGISYHWENNTESANTAVFLIGATINILTSSDDQGNEVMEQLDMFNFQKKSYEKTCDINGSHFYYLSADYGEHNWFSVDVIE